MTIFDLIKLAASNLWRRRMRTALTVLGVVIGTACIIVMITLGLENLRQTEEAFGGEDLEVITVNASSEMYMGGGMVSSSSGNSQMDDNTVESFRRINGVKAVSPTYSFTLTAKVGKYRANLYILAIDLSALGKIQLEKGELFAAGNSSPQLLLTTNALMEFQDPKGVYVDYYEEFNEWDYMNNRRKSEEEIAEMRKKLPGPDVDWLNTDLKLSLGYEYTDEEMLMYFGEGETNNMPKSKKYTGTVTGIIDRKNYSIWYSIMDINVANKMIKENRKLASESLGITEGKYNEIRVVAESVDEVEGIVAKIREMGYQPQNYLSMIEEQQAGVRRQQSQLMIIAAISLLVSAIGIANTMLTTIMERRSEIGVMKVVGMKIRSINFLFLTEATIIGLVGGLAGTALSYLVVFLLNNSLATSTDGSFMGMYLGENVQLGIPIWLIGVAVGIAMLTGLISGLYPSWKATKMSPLEAIRST